MGYLNALIIIMLAPFMMGLIRKIKALMQNRRGASVFQPYFDLIKLFRKDMVISTQSSWIFRIAPFIYFAASIGAAIFTPLIVNDLSKEADFFILLYILALGRFFMVLASLDTASAFGGMGGSRETYFSVLIEPTIFLALLTIAFKAGSTNLNAMAAISDSQLLNFSLALGAAAYILVAVAEIGRVPVDNPDTHLELTMAHEGMILDYSGPYLALIHLAFMIKQSVIMILFMKFFLPWGMFMGTSYLLKVGCVIMAMLFTAFLLAFIETSTNKMRLFRVPGYIGVSCLLSLLAFISQ